MGRLGTLCYDSSMKNTQIALIVTMLVQAVLWANGSLQRSLAAQLVPYLPAPTCTAPQPYPTNPNNLIDQSWTNPNSSTSIQRRLDEQQQQRAGSNR